MTTVRFAAEGDTLWAYLCGEIDHDSARRLRLRIDEEAACRMPALLVLDLGGVGFMDSSGIGLILGRQRRMQALGGRVLVSRPPAAVQKVLRLAHIDDQEVLL